MNAGSRIDRRLFTAITTIMMVGVILAGCSRSDTTAGEAKPPSAAELKRHNVLLVTLDTTRVDYLSCYDASKAGLTPNFDAVAAEGAKFDYAIAQSAGTPMSHASILTGLNPYQHGVRVISAAGGYKLDAGIPTLATVLTKHGWDTGAFLSAFTVSEYYGFDNGFAAFDNGLDTDPDGILQDVGGGFCKWEQEQNQRRSDATIDKALEWLGRERSSPFFMWLHLWDPHDRMILPPEEVVARFMRPGMSEDDHKRAVYQAEVHYIDQQFGRMLDELKRSGRYDDTMIVIVGDHGQGLGQHDWWSHRLLYQEDIHVPLIVRAPGWKQGTSVAELVRTIDIYPTVLEALGVEPRDGVEGLSLSGLAAGKTEPTRRAYSDQINKYDFVSKNVTQNRPNDDLVYSAIEGKWKLVYRQSRPELSELFNLADDPHELKNLYAENSEQVRRLKAYLDECNGYVTAPFEGDAGPGQRTLEHLESLGYVGGDDEEEDEAAASRPTSQPVHDVRNEP